MKSLIKNLFALNNSHKAQERKSNVQFKSHIKAGGADGTVYNNADGSGSGTMVQNGANETVDLL